ncbi:hypothetical protein HPB51_020915 [Rhipicephalus microplus]|uniref:Protein kinase domain-containing protein n=1 Tax=Rhipicephalus microplus TaxID=6941 RepID=A0A9J6ECI3_RHIMP|nr:hypothetical protein HPB51_020915 [Rhipicephalus microplus]
MIMRDAVMEGSGDLVHLGIFNVRPNLSTRAYNISASIGNAAASAGIRSRGLRLTEALSFLHYSCKLIHRNLCPQSVIVNKRGTWKLAGLEFTEKCSDTDLLSPVSCQPFTSKLPKMGQPDLDYTAPEIQATSSCSPLSDMFSLGLVICALFNNGRSIIEGNLSTTTYNKQLEVLEGSLHNLLDRVPHHLQEPLQGLLQVDPRRRPNAQNFSMKLWWQHVLPSLKMELQSPEVLAAALQPLLFIIEESTVDEYQTIILPIFRSVFGMPKSVQATVTLLENLDVLMKKTPKTDIKADVLPMLYNSFDSTTPQIQCAAMHAIAQIADYLEESAVRKMVLPRTKQAFENNSGIKVQANALTCIEKIIDKLEKTDILDEVLPMLGKAKLQDPAILMPVVRIYKHMLSDKRYGLTVNLLATKVMPALIPVVVSPALKLDQFTSLIELLQEMLEHVSKSQRNKLKLEKLSIPSTDMLPVQTPYNMEQPTGYPHRPPSLRLESRRTSISMDDVVRRTCSSASSSPDSNLLRVQATLPGRRHSDNTIQPPRILVAPCSPEGTVSYTPGGLPVRRHSSVGTQDSRFSGFFSSPKMASPNLGVDFFSSSRANVRRYSAAAVCGAAGLPNAANQASSFLQQIGSGVSSLAPPQLCVTQ